MEYERLLMDHVGEEQLLCDHDTRDGTRHGPRFVMVTVCKAAGGAVCDRRAINFRSKAGKSEQARPRGLRPPGMPPGAGPLPRCQAAPAPAAARHISAAGPAQTEALRDALLFSQPMDRSAEVRTTKGTTRLLGHIASSTPPITERPSPSREESARAFHGASLLSIKLRIGVAQSRSATPGIDRTADVAACQWRRRGAKSLLLCRATARWP